MGREEGAHPCRAAAVQDVRVRVAEPAGLDLNQGLAGAGLRNRQFTEDETLLGVEGIGMLSW